MEDTNKRPLDHNQLKEDPASKRMKAEKTPRELAAEAKREAKMLEQERKQALKRQKKAEEEERRRLKKLADEEERRLKREKIEAERKARIVQKEREREEKMKRRQEELRLRELERKRKEEEKLKRKEEEMKRKEKERLRKEEERQRKLKEDDEKRQRRKFQKYFLPFHINQNVVLHTPNYEIDNTWESFLNDPSGFTIPKSSQEPISKDSAATTRAFDVLQRLNAGSLDEASRLFPSVPLRYIKFYENRKPAYVETFSYTVADTDTPDLYLNPCTRVHFKCEQRVIDYDIDSDVEEGDYDEGEGEDLDSADDDDDDDDDDMNSSDIDEFVDDDSKSEKKRKIIGPLVPIIRHYQQDIDENDEFGQQFKSIHWELIDSTLTLPIDPFKDYWTEPKTPKKPTAVTIDSLIASTPPNASVSAAVVASAGTDTNTNGEDSTNQASPSTPSTLSVKKKVITEPEHVSALLTFVQNNSSFSINTLAELAAKDNVCGPLLAKYSRAVLKNTVKEHASFDKRTGWKLSST
ncbi:hypothetical protein JL09_g2268 [Pichia kudriavzevii]|uniref:Chromatin assembly factor 1 subunit A dimerization domain-containing protein n=1 Tax=Pichia kudriavzevii TaxID=4909 RepID=A0A099P0G8_PICKU|nr:hypothetical protein JL09_g2268 [Pichia kudriavzevii]